MVLCNQHRAPEQQQADPHTHQLNEGPGKLSGPSTFLGSQKIQGMTPTLSRFSLVQNI
jgi:hypothetical protein